MARSCVRNICGSERQKRMARRPIAGLGIEWPGAPLPSSVLMTVVPAKVAGVGRVVVVTPPQRDGAVNPAVLFACALTGVDELYAVGGAQAIAALAYGTATVRAVDKIVGPGNVYVTEAKRQRLSLLPSLTRIAPVPMGSPRPTRQSSKKSPRRPPRKRQSRDAKFRRNQFALLLLRW